MQDPYTVEYYDARAAEYEDVYFREAPDQRAELNAISEEMCEWLAGRRVLELACGTGYWTERVWGAAAHVVATDASPRMLARARSKGMPPDRVELLPGDAYQPGSVAGDFDAVLANFFLSHVPRRFVCGFLGSLRQRLGPGGRLFMADNCFVAGLGGETAGPDEHGDYYKQRTLLDGTAWRVVKNYYDEAALAQRFGDVAEMLDLRCGAYYWRVRCTLR